MSEHLTSEGDADIAARDCRGRVLANGGPDIGIAADHPEIDAVYEKYTRGDITRSDAAADMGYLYATVPVTNDADDATDTQLEYYDRLYSTLWDKRQILDDRYGDPSGP